MCVIVYFLVGLLQLMQAHELLAQTLIGECPGRSVPQLRSEATQFELSLLFYYVSWSSDARQARLVYDGVAHYYHDYAYFGAIDCWHLQCNCSRTHRSPHGVAGGFGYPDKWPTLIVRYGHQTLQYLGSWHFEDLTRFMNHLIQPIDRVHSYSELNALRRISDAVVLAALESVNSKAYKRFVAAAVRWLELDPDRNVRYTVTFKSDILQILKSETNTLPQLAIIDNRHMHMYNVTKPNNWSVMDILRWVGSTLKGTAWMSDGYGTPMTIALKATHAPVLVMGIRAPQHTIGQHSETSWFGEETHLFGTHTHRKEAAGCAQYWKVDNLWNNRRRQRDFSILQMPVELYPNVQALKGAQLKYYSHVPCQLNAATLKNYYHINSYLSYLWSQYTYENHYMEHVGVTATQLLELHARNRCLAHSQHGTPALKIGIAKLVTRYGQLMSQHSIEQSTQNRSLAVVLFDASKYRDFLQQLGIGQNHHYHTKREAAPVQVFIVDVAQEALHVMPQNHPFSYLALKEFIKQFYARQLPRMQRNALVSPTSGTAYIYGYNRQLLLQALQRSNATNVVLMHRPDCALSAVMSQTFMQVAALLRSPDMNFIRFDSQSNDLPWELSMPVTPALLVFPQSRPAESVLFPIDIKADVQNVFAFILAQLEPEQQLRLVLASCRRRMRHVRSCLDFARTLVLQHVSQYLKYWEIFEKERDLILSHLKQFNEIHIAIDSSIGL